MTTTSHPHDSSHAARISLLAGGWRQLSEKVNRAMCALRAINGLRHQVALVFPGHFSQGKSRAWLDAPSGTQVVRLPVQAKPGDTTQAHFMVMLMGPALRADGTPHPQPRECPTALLFYSAEMNLAAVAPQVERLRRLGMNVACPEYLGYGMSSGEPSEKAFYATADTALRYVLEQPQTDPQRVLLVGCGVGGAVATELAARHDVAGLVLLSTMTSMCDLLQHRLPDRTVQMLVRHRFDTAQRLKDVKCPILIAHGSDDQHVPADMLEPLALSARSVVRRVLLEGCALHGAQLLEEQRVCEAIVKFTQDLRPRQVVAPMQEQPMAMLRPVPMRLADRSTGGPRIPAAYSPEHASEPSGAFPARIPLPQFPRPASRAS